MALILKDKMQRFTLFNALLAVAVLLSIPAALMFGTINIDSMQAVHIVLNKLVPEYSFTESISIGVQNIVWELRVPRMLMACLTGAGLAIAGLTLQSITQNNLADPHLLGISSGAVFGAVITTLHIGEIWGEMTLPVMAFSGALIATLFVAFISHRATLGGATKLLMCGVAISFVLMSAANFSMFLGDTRSSHHVIFWMLGGLGQTRWDHLLLPCVICVVGYGVLYAQRHHINALLMGDETALSLGINVKRLRIQLFITSALVTSILVANTGAIGFVGLMIPHIGRYFVGHDVHRLLPVCALLGALFLLWVDVLSRTLLSPEELPIGIITGLIGGIFFIVLLLRQAE